MMYSLSYQMYKYEHEQGAAEQRAADVGAGEVAAAARDLRLRFGHAFRLRRRARAAHRTADAMTTSVRLPSGVR